MRMAHLPFWAGNVIGCFGWSFILKCYVTFCNLIGLQWMLYSVYTNARLGRRGSHLDIACRSIVTRIKYPDPTLGAWLFWSSWLLDLQWFKGQKHCHTSLVAEKVCWWVGVSSWSLDQLVKGILIASSHFDPSHKQQHVHDYHFCDN